MAKCWYPLLICGIPRQPLFCANSQSMRCGKKLTKMAFSAPSTNSSLPTDLLTVAADAGSDPATADIHEGLAKLNASAVEEGRGVFYNPVQEFNRDLSSAVLSVFARDVYESNTARTKQLPSSSITPENSANDQRERNISTVRERGKRFVGGITVLEALAASGFRSCRYAREVPGIDTVIVNDLSKAAFNAIKFNAEQNHVSDMIEPCNMDAVKLMYKLFIDSRLMHAIDLDPYGTSGPFIEPALRALNDGGMLMITSTDSAVLCGNTPEVCLKRYHAMSLKIPSHHEMAVRILLGTIARRAATLDRYIRPLVCLQEGFYIRVFVQVLDGALQAKDYAVNNSYVYSCSQCTSFSLQPLGVKTSDHKYVASVAHTASGEKCRHCNTAVRMGGPVWNGPLVDRAFTQRVVELVSEAGFYKSAPRIKSKLALLAQELPDAPLFYVVSEMCKAVHCQMLPLKLARSAIINAGYRVSSAHCHQEGLKTNAPQDFLWDMIRAWVERHPVKQTRIEGQPAQTILERKRNETYEIDFAERADADQRGDVELGGGARYPHNPQPHWGPKKMAKRAKRPAALSSSPTAGTADAVAINSTPRCKKKHAAIADDTMNDDEPATRRVVQIV